MSMSVTSVRLKAEGGGGMGAWDHVIAETSQFTVRVSLCARSLLRLSLGLRSTLCFHIAGFLFYSDGQRRKEKTQKTLALLWSRKWMFEGTFFCPIQRYLESEIFFHGLATYSHLDVKRCNENEVKVLTPCLGFVLFRATKEQPWYIMCPHFGVIAI